MRRLNLVSSSALMMALCALLACGGQPQPEGEPTLNDPQSGELEGGASEVPPGKKDEGPRNPLDTDTDKVTICHIPPGNPANAHTITVGRPALKAHTKHGDTLGACGSDGGTGGDVDAGTGGGDVDAGPGDGDVDAGPGDGDVDAGPGDGDVDAGPGGGDVDAGVPACGLEGSTCGSSVFCCRGLTCGPDGYCEPIIR